MTSYWPLLIQLETLIEDFLDNKPNLEWLSCEMIDEKELVEIINELKEAIKENNKQEFKNILQDWEDTVINYNYSDDYFDLMYFHNEDDEIELNKPDHIEKFMS